MPFIDCQVELKLKWKKYCVFSAGGTENDVNHNDNVNNIIFTIKDTFISKRQSKIIKTS